MGKNHAVIHKRLAAINVDAVSPFVLDWSCCQNATGPWPMHDVVPSAVRAAVRIDTMT